MFVCLGAGWVDELVDHSDEFLVGLDDLQEREREKQQISSDPQKKQTIFQTHLDDAFEDWDVALELGDCVWVGCWCAGSPLFGSGGQTLHEGSQIIGLGVQLINSWLNGGDIIIGLR